MEGIDEHFVQSLRTADEGPAAMPTAPVDVEALRQLYRAQAESRHLDFAARWLQAEGLGYYTIGSAGHEANAAVALATRVDDPALLHYRSGGFYSARALQAGRADAVRDVLRSLTASAHDPISGGRHKVFGNRELNIIPQTSTISSHLPRAVGLAHSLGLARTLNRSTPWPQDAIVVASFGDASSNHSTATGALNAAAYLTNRHVPCPILFLCEDNRIGISTRSPDNWPAAMLAHLPGIPYFQLDGSDPAALLTGAAEAVHRVRDRRAPAVVHLNTVRFMGHAGSDAEIAYRTRREILQDHEKDPILATARALVALGAATPDELLEEYEATRDRVLHEAREVGGEPHLGSAHAVRAPLAFPSRSPLDPVRADRTKVWRGKLPEDAPAMTLAQSINATLTDLMAAHPEALAFGEDVAAKGGVYGVTRGLRKQFGGHRVFDTLLDEQTILGVALGSALAGFVPIPEIQYLAYVHNALDQLRGEAASLRFFSAGRYQNGMVVRIAGLAYQRGFGGHFHNDNSVAALRDIPGMLLAVPSHPADAPRMLRTCFAHAQQEGRVCVFLEPIALYHARDLRDESDGLWTAKYPAPGAQLEPGEIGVYGDGRDLLIVTFGNGVPMSLRAQRDLAAQGMSVTVADLRWLAPLPVTQLLDLAGNFSTILVADETRHTGGVSEAVITALVDGGYVGRITRVTSEDSFIPLGPAATEVLLTEADIVAEALRAVADARLP